MNKKLIDSTNLSHLWDKIKNLVSTSVGDKKNTQNAVSDPSASGTSIEFISGITQNAQGVISPSKKTVSTMTGASVNADGAAGLVPKPTAGNQGKYLRADGTYNTPTNTKNTAGSTDSSSKLFLIGATSQAANPQTYSHDTAYVGTDGCLYSGSKKVLTDHQDISGKANLASPTFTGTPKAPTASAGTNTTQIATTAFVQTAVGKAEVLVISVASFNSLPQTISNSNIESDMVAVNSVLSNPSAQASDWTVTTSSGSLTIAGSINGSTTMTIYLSKSR